MALKSPDKYEFKSWVLTQPTGLVLGAGFVGWLMGAALTFVPLAASPPTRRVAACGPPAPPIRPAGVWAGLKSSSQLSIMISLSCQTKRTGLDLQIMQHNKWQSGVIDDDNGKVFLYAGMTEDLFRLLSFPSEKCYLYDHDSVSHHAIGGVVLDSFVLGCVASFDKNLLTDGYIHIAPEEYKLKFSTAASPKNEVVSCFQAILSKRLGNSRGGMFSWGTASLMEDPRSDAVEIRIRFQ